MQPFDSSESENPFESPGNAPVESHREVPFAAGELRPFKTMWLHPRLTIRRLVDESPDLYVVPLLCLAGIGQTLDRASTRNAGNKMSTVSIVSTALVVGPLAGLFGMWVLSHLLRVAGTWIGGTAPREYLRTAIAWSSLPAVCALPLWIPQLLLFGSDMFTSEMPRLEAQPLLSIPLLAIAAIEITLVVWGIVLLCNTVAEVQGFRSAWKGLANLLLAGLIVAAALIALVIVAVAVSSGLRR